MKYLVELKLVVVKLMECNRNLHRGVTYNYRSDMFSLMNETERIVDGWLLYLFFDSRMKSEVMKKIDRC